MMRAIIDADVTRCQVKSVQFAARCGKIPLGTEVIPRKFPSEDQGLILGRLAW